MELTIIAAVSENNVIGNKGKIPWDIREDRKRFRDLTKNHPMIIGRKTHESILEQLGHPLGYGRKSIVLSKTLEQQKGIYIARTIEEALELTEEQDTYIGGGGEIYRLFIPLATCMEITKIHNYYEGDTFFPEVNWSNWNLVNGKIHESKEGIPYSFLTFKREK